MNKVLVNGVLLDEDSPALRVSNRSFRYGDGLFETMRMEMGIIFHQDLHFDRLLYSFRVLGWHVPAGFTGKIADEMVKLAGINGCGGSGRVRLAVFPAGSDLGSPTGDPGYVIECLPLPEPQSLNTRGLRLGIFDGARKSPGPYSRLKTASALVYAQAARFATAKNYDDCLVLNSHGAVADTTIANLFVVKDQRLLTPGLEEGGVAGVMRRYIMEHPSVPYKVEERPITPADLADADECFLTNAIRGIRWVERFGDRVYGNQVVQDLHNRLFSQR